MSESGEIISRNIIIVGCGKVGAALTEELCEEGHNITLIDTNEERVNKLTDSFDVMGVVGNGASYSVLKDAGIEEADLFIAVTDMDELNLLCCTVARRASHCEAIARVRNPEYSDDISYLKEKLDLAMIINPDEEAAKVIARMLGLPAALSVKSFANGRAEMVRFVIPAENRLCGRQLKDLSDVTGGNVLICAVERGEDIYIPDGSFTLHEGDQVTFISNIIAARRFFERIGIQNRRIHHVVIVGGGKASYYLCKLLIEDGIEVKVIEKNKQRCEELCDLLPKAIIINGDGNDRDLLREEKIADADAFIPLTGMDEENIFLTLFASDVSNAKVITKLKRNTFHDVIGKLNIGSVVYPKYITAEMILTYVRGLSASMDYSNIRTLYHFFGSRVEAIEFEAAGNSKTLNIPLKDIRTKDNLLIAGLIRGRRNIIPGGDDAIRQGDRVIVVTTHIGLRSLDDIIA